MGGISFCTQAVIKTAWAPWVETVHNILGFYIDHLKLGQNFTLIDTNFFLCFSFQDVGLKHPF